MKHAAPKGITVLALGFIWSVHGQEPDTPPPAATVEKPDPKESAARVKRALQQAPGPKARDLSITVHGDTLVLSGEVDSQAQVASAETTAMAAANGARISNQLKVRAPEDNAEQLKEQKLLRDVQAALRSDARTANLGVVVSMDDAGVIGLHGLVPSRDGRAMAERVASQVAGVKQLRNHLAVPGEQ